MNVNTKKKIPNGIAILEENMMKDAVDEQKVAYVRSFSS